VKYKGGVNSSSQTILDRHSNEGPIYSTKYFHGLGARMYINYEEAFLPQQHPLPTFPLSTWNSHFAYTKKFETYFLIFFLPFKIKFYSRKSPKNTFQTFYSWAKWNFQVDKKYVGEKRIFQLWIYHPYINMACFFFLTSGCC
jgi:hypothetical protein